MRQAANYLRQRASMSSVWLLASMVAQLAVARPHDGSNSIQKLPRCESNSACGYVQLNTRGVSSQELCRCPQGVSCPLEWDPLDGRTISHGNDQYKFCKRHPRLELCSRHDIVYSSYMEMAVDTMETLVNTVRLHCLCPPTYLYMRNHTKIHHFPDGISAFSVSHICAPPPLCSPTDPCMAITESFDDVTSFVTRQCACPVGLFCPNNIKLASERVKFDRGAYYLMHCL